MGVLTKKRLWIKDILLERVHEYHPYDAKSHRKIIRKINSNSEQIIKLRSSYKHPSEPKELKVDKKNTLNFILSEINCGHLQQKPIVPQLLKRTKS